VFALWSVGLAVDPPEGRGPEARDALQPLTFCIRLSATRIAGVATKIYIPSAALSRCSSAAVPFPYRAASPAGPDTVPSVALAGRSGGRAPPYRSVCA
jgi:hypothetical protein